MVDSFESAEPTDGRIPLPDPQALLWQTDWTALEHAGGRAGDIPVALVQLTDEDPDVRAKALGFLERINHQNSIYSATAPAALYIAGILSHPRTIPAIDARYPTWRIEHRSLRAVLLDWLGDMAGDVSDESAWLAARHGISVDGRPEIVTLRAVRPTIFAAVSQFLNDGDADVRTAAVTAAAQLLDAQELAGHREALLTPMKDVLVNSRDGHQRARVKSTLLSWSEKPSVVGDFAKAVADAVISSLPEHGTGDAPF